MIKRWQTQCILYQFLVPCQDTDYQGYAPEKAKIIQPVKKKSGKKLTEEQKEFNREVSRIRVRVEYAIGSVRFMRIVKEECRLKANWFVEQFLLYMPLCIISELKSSHGHTKTNLRKLYYLDESSFTPSIRLFSFKNISNSSMEEGENILSWP